MSKLILLSGFVLGFLTACSTLFTPQFSGEQLKLLSPEAGPEAALLKQKMTIHSLKTDQSLISLTRLDPEQTQVMVLVPAGQPLLTMRYDGELLTVENKTEVDFPAHEIMAMLQFSLWPEAAISNAYPQNAGWQFQSGPGQRVLMRHGKVWLTVNYEHDKTLLQNAQRGVTLSITMLESTAFE